MGENEALLKKAWEGLNHLLIRGHINETFIGLLYFIKSINEDNLQIGITDKEMEEILDEDDIDEPGVLSMGEGLFEKLKNFENSMKNSTIITIEDIDLEELFKKLNED